MNHTQFATLTRALNHVGVYNPRTIAKEQRGFVAKYNSGAETSDDDDAEGDE